MSDYTINLDFSNTTMGMAQVNKIISDRIHQAVGLAAQSIYATWADKVMKAPGIWHPERIAYVKSLQWSYTGEHSARIWTENKTAEEIETGRPARDLKRMLRTSSKTKISKKGLLYLIIPFRHGTPGNGAHAPAMPSDIYKIVGDKNFKKSKVLSSSYSHVGNAIDGSAALINWTRLYQWGSRLGAGNAPKAKDHHATDIYAGMMRFDTSTGKSKSSSYLTMRVMTERSTGWIIGAKPGQFIARDVEAEATANVEAIVADTIAG